MKRRGVKPNSGREKMFEVREIESDISFLRDYKIVDKDWKSVRDQLVSMRVNGEFPYITVNDGDYLKNGELYLKHWFEDIELDVKYLEKVLPHLYYLWGRTVHIGGQGNCV